MIKVTAKATQLMARHFKGKEKQPIRLYVKLGACGIRSFGVSMEAPTRQDAVFEVDGFVYVINKRLLKKVEPVKVDADSVGFRISGSGVYPPGGCGTCGYMCGAQGGGHCTGDCVNCKLPCSHGLRARGRKKRGPNE